ncbi:ATP-dependent DNA helicase [Halocalculus aciditolerans]|uniref:Helicase n=1 Tax=Halocalculus aciditolerans TaxID=1383812 RepID=A0A830F1X2_9EURY|nr:ATP-dependent DNA helicase [Halocalculus aciditolerans]GGL54602.1 helicase [Halocalculus aciditolerans]
MSDAATSPEWGEFFGFDEPYENQADAVEAALDAARDGGFLAMEGPCGTGKTMAALTAGATLVRGPSQFERVLVVTPVKQQLEQFVDDLRTMNAGLDDPLRGVSLVGKRDLCPYGREDLFGEQGVNDRCEDLRETTSGLVEGGEGHDGQRIEELTKLRSETPDDPWWNPARGRELAKSARADDPETLANSLSTAGAESPYVRHQPTAPADLADGQEDVVFCPFEADWYGRDKGSPVDFSVGAHSVVTSDDFLPAAVEAGTCPHRVQSVLLEHADVVVGNYNHLFDADTRPLLEGLLDESTFVVVDEAHRIEERVRGLLSDRVGRSTLVRARNDLSELVRQANQSKQAKAEVQEELAGRDVRLQDVKAARDFYADVTRWLDERVEEHLAAFDEYPEEDVEIPLREPEVVAPDELTRWAEGEGHTGGLWRALAAVGGAVEEALGDDRNCVCAAVGVIMGRWWERGHATYFREIELEHSPGDVGEARAYLGTYNPGLVQYNCMPAREVAGVLGELGGGVLMSATLEPIDVFRAVTGLDRLANGDEPRPVIERTYDLPFPEENRASFTVDATAFTARNRGDPGEDTRTRGEYEQVLRTVARSPGNVLVCMPNYREAAWAADYLRGVVEKPVLVDESSSNEATDDLKDRFFRGPGKVLVTSTRGTLTEGVDYDGDKLAACCVVGVPLVKIGSPRVRATRRAYGDAFGEDNAFEYALTVPAVRRARQAIGRVIRGADERGVRVLAGGRYVKGAPRSVYPYLGPEERAEFVRMTPEFLGAQIDAFWDE